MQELMLKGHMRVYMYIIYIYIYIHVAVLET